MPNEVAAMKDRDGDGQNSILLNSQWCPGLMVVFPVQDPKQLKLDNATASSLCANANIFPFGWIAIGSFAEANGK